VAWSRIVHNSEKLSLSAIRINRGGMCGADASGGFVAPVKTKSNSSAGCETAPVALRD